MSQRCYNGVRLLGDGPCLRNVEKIDMGCLPMLASMMDIGMQVELSHFAGMDKVLTDDMDQITENVHDLTGYYINMSSPAQKADLLFKKLGLKQARIKMTKTGDRESVVDEVLQAIQHDHPVVPEMLEYAELDKLRGTYVRPMPKLAKRVAFGEYRMFPNLGQNRIPSSRLNCKEPNLLAMPTRTKRGREIRRGFITRPGWKLVTADESQIEPRLAAHSSLDPGLLNVYLNNEDIYSDYATDSFKLEDKRFRNAKGKWEYPTVDSVDHRRPSKTCVLAALYDVTAPGLLEQMPIMCATCKQESREHTVKKRAAADRPACNNFKALWTEQKCQDLLNAFYMKYPGVLRDRKLNHARARKFGYVWDMWGRILHVAAVRSVLEWVVSAALREVGNFPYQAGAQGTIKLVMAEVEDDRIAMGMEDVVHPLLQVHDELIFECREDVAEEWIGHVCYRFENCVRLAVPVKAGSASAYTWGDLEK